MKIAILYSGTIRNLNETINNNIDCFNYGDIDLYFSIWDHIGYSDRINSPDYIMSNRILDKDTKITEDIIRNIVPQNINIKAIKIEKYNPDDYMLDLINGTDNPGLHAQYYKILDCFNLLDDSENYDFIVRLRCDLFLQEKISKEYIMECNNQIIFPSKIWYDYCWTAERSSINEMMWISNKELMKKVCNIYNNGDKINSIICNKNMTDPNYGESICFMNLMAENIAGNIKTFDFNYLVLR